MHWRVEGGKKTPKSEQVQGVHRGSIDLRRSGARMGSKGSKSKDKGAAKASSAAPPKAPEAGKDAGKAKDKGAAVQRVQKDLEKDIGGGGDAKPKAAAGG